MDAVVINYSLQRRYQMRCSGGLSHLTFASLLMTTPVLSAIMDSTGPQRQPSYLHPTG
jgi:hypothetical protein